MTAGDPKIECASAPSVCNSDALHESQLEAAIEAAKQRLYSAPTREGKIEHWRDMCRLIDQKFELSPPSTSVRLAKASAECRGNAVGGVS